MTLLDAKRGRPFRILRIADDTARAQCIRFGIGEGMVVDSAEKLPLGPVLVRQRNQEICVGRGLAERISVEEVVAGRALRGDCGNCSA
jgi:Fe2+ transport system protein FeoA